MAMPASIVNQSAGTPKAWRARSSFIQVHVDSIRTLGPVGAIIFELVVFRCEINPDGWEASADTISDETGIPTRTVERQTKKLREEGYLLAERAGTYNATMRWKPIWADDQGPGARESGAGDPVRRDGGTETADTADSETAKGAKSQTANVAVSSISKKGQKTDKTLSSKPLGSSDQESVDRPAVTRVCEHLANKLVSNGCRPPTVSSKWLEAAHQLIDTEGRTEAEVIRVIDYATTDTFWKPIILSMPKLCEKYDTLRLKCAGQRRSYRSADVWDNEPQQEPMSDAEASHFFGLLDQCPDCMPDAPCRLALDQPEADNTKPTFAAIAPATEEELLRLYGPQESGTHAA